MSVAYNGLRVVELADRSAALTGRILADLGAEVVLVEPPAGQALRHEAPFLQGQADPEAGLGHLYLNTNKRSVILDLDDAVQRARFRDLVASADVLLETEPPGRLADLQMSHEDLRQINPGLIQCSVTPFGLTTAWRHWRAADIVAGAAGGLIQVSGSARGTPVQGRCESFVYHGRSGSGIGHLHGPVSAGLWHGWPQRRGYPY